MAAQERRLSQIKYGAMWNLGPTNHRIYDSLVAMDADRDALPDDIDALKGALLVERAKAVEVTAELMVARAKASEDVALIAQQKLRIAKLERQVYGQRSERSARLIDQLALEFEELEAAATEDELAAETAVAKTMSVRGFTRKRPERNTFPDHLPRERVVIDPPMACECCGGNRLRKLGEDVTRTLETQPRRWKVIETVREKFSCRDCEKITQAPAPFHVIARGWAGPSLLAMIVFEKFGQHQPLNRQAERYALEGVPIALSTMADAVGSVCAALDSLLRLVESHVMAAERLHGDDTTVPVLSKGKTDTGRCWIYVRDDRPFGGTGPPAAMFYYSRDRKGEHPQAHLARYAGILQADAYDGYNRLYQAGRSPGTILEAACWVHARSSPWPTSRKTLDAKPQAGKRSRCHPSRSRSCSVSMRCSRSSDPSMAKAPRSAWPPGRYRAGHWSRIFMPICVRSSLRSLAGTTWPKRSTTFSSAGLALRYSSRTAAYVSRTTPPKEG
jgi:transposase